MEKKKINFIVVFILSILLVLSLSVGLTSAMYTAKRKASGLVAMDTGIVFEFGNVSGEGKSRKLLLSDGNELSMSLTVKDSVELLNPYVKIMENSVPCYLRVKVSFKFYNGKDEVALTRDESEVLKEIFVVDKLNQVISFNEKFLPDENNEWFYYSKASGENATGENLEAITFENGKIDIFTNPTINVENFDTEYGSPNEVDRVELFLNVDLLQASEGSVKAFNLVKEDALKNKILSDGVTNIFYTETATGIEVVEIKFKGTEDTDPCINEIDVNSFGGKTLVINPSVIMEGKRLKILDAGLLISVYENIIDWSVNGFTIVTTIKVIEDAQINVEELVDYCAAGNFEYE